MKCHTSKEEEDWDSEGGEALQIDLVGLSTLHSNGLRTPVLDRAWTLIFLHLKTDVWSMSVLNFPFYCICIAIFTLKYLVDHLLKLTEYLSNVDLEIIEPQAVWLMSQFGPIADVINWRTDLLNKLEHVQSVHV